MDGKSAMQKRKAEKCRDRKPETRRLRNWEERKWRRTQRPRKETSERKGLVTSEREGGEQRGRGAWRCPQCMLLTAGASCSGRLGPATMPLSLLSSPSSTLPAPQQGGKCLPVSGPQDLHLQNGRWWWTVILAPVIPPSSTPLPSPSLPALTRFCAWVPLPNGFLLGSTHSKGSEGRRSQDALALAPA